MLSMSDVKNLTYRGYLYTSAFVVLIVVLVYFALGHIKKLSLQQIGNSLSTVLTTVQDAHHLWIEQRISDVAEFAARPELISYTSTLLNIHANNGSVKGSKPLIQMRELIRGYLTRNDDQGFFIIAPNNISIGSMRDNNLDTLNLIYLQKPQLLTASFNGQTVFIPTILSDVPLSPNTVKAKSTPTMFITTPIKTNGKTIAVLAIRTNPAKHFTRITQLGRFGQSGETYAFDKSGTLITNSRFDIQLRQAGIIGIQENSILNIHITDPGGNLLTGHKSDNPSEQLPLTFMARNAIAQRDGINLIGYRDYRGVTVVGAWLWDKAYGFGLATEVDIEEALIPYYNSRTTLLAVVSLVCLLGYLLANIINRMNKITAIKLTQAHNTLEVRVTERTQELEQAKHQLSKANEELNELAITDSLTGLYNRRHFDQHIRQEWRRCQREQQQLVIILFDVDYFKAYNDHYGHLKGDECLQKISSHLAKLRMIDRPGDIIARYGGEEFVICLSNATKGHALKVANNIQKSIEKLNIPHQKSAISEIQCVTVSVGLAYVIPDKENTAELLIHQADEALYLAKHQGRNQVKRYTPEDNSNSNLTRIY